MKRVYAKPRVVSRPREKCAIADCPRLEELANGRSTGGLCAGHRYRKKRQRQLEEGAIAGKTGPRMPAFEAPIDDALGRRRGAAEEELVVAAVELREARGPLAQRAAQSKLRFWADRFGAEIHASRRRAPSFIPRGALALAARAVADAEGTAEYRMAIGVLKFWAVRHYESRPRRQKAPSK
ncbi:MAG: hypothetical protein QM817_10265 [Archangium sp.]